MRFGGGARNTPTAGPSGPLVEHAQTSDVSIPVLNGTITCRTFSTHDPVGSTAERLADGYNAAEQAGNDALMQKYLDAAMRIEVDFVERQIRQAADEDTALCCGSGEFAMRVANSLLNAQTAAEAKLCLTAYKPAAFMQRPVSADGLTTIARDTFLEELVANSSAKRSAIVARTKGELSAFVNKVATPNGGTSTHQEFCFVAADGSCVGLFDATTHGGVADQLEAAHGQFAHERAYNITRTVVVVAVPHDIMRSMFWLEASPTIQANPMFTLRVGAFAPQEIAVWLTNRQHTALTREMIRRQFVDESVDLEGVPDDLAKEYVASCESYADSQSRRVAQGLCRMEPASALARASCPVEFASLLFNGPRGDPRYQFPREGVEFTLPDVLDDEDSYSVLVFASCSPFVGVGYAGDICRRMWVEQRNLAMGQLDPDQRERMFAVDEEEEIPEDGLTFLVEHALAHPVVCTPLKPEQVVLLFGAPLHLFAQMRVGSIHRIEDVLRSSLYAPHLPEPSRLKAGLADIDGTRDLVQKHLPNAAVLVNGADTELPKEIMDDKHHNQLPHSDMYLLRGFMESGEGIASLEDEIAAVAATEPQETEKQRRARERQEMSEKTLRELQARRGRR